MIARARENARGTQESLGVDAWSEVNRLYLYLSGQRAQRKFHSSPSAFYAAIKQACILFDGLVQNTLPRDEVYHFLELGRYLERVNVMGRILHAKCRSHNEGNDRRRSADATDPLDGPACGAARLMAPISASSATGSSRSA